MVFRRPNTRTVRLDSTEPYSRRVNISGNGSNTSRVYCGNLSWEVTENMLKDLMTSAGKVASVNIKTDGSGRSKGYGIVEFFDKRSANKAIDDLNDIEFHGRLMQVYLSSLHISPTRFVKIVKNV